MDAGRLHYLKKLGLKPQTTCRLLDVAPFDGPLTIEIEQKSVSVAPSLASLIGVEAMEQEISDE
jgi:DtxR family Mn-dependent transcriptional regulator